MLDIVLSRLKEEIAIDGPSGSSMDNVWGYVGNILSDIVSSRKNFISPVVDDSLKSFIWEHLKVEKGLWFYGIAKDTTSKDVAANDNSELEGASTSGASVQKSVHKKKPVAKRKRKVDDSDSEEYCDDSPEESSEEEFEQEEKENTQKSTKSTETLEESRNNSLKIENGIILKPISNVETLEYDEIKTSVSPLYVMASENYQDEQIMIGVPPGAPIPGNQLAVLRVIMRSRKSGIQQVKIPELFDVDGRGAGHYAKALEQRGAIIRRVVSSNKLRTNVCVHVRFTSAEKEVDMRSIDHIEYTNIQKQIFSIVELREALINLVIDVPGRAIVLKDALVELGFNVESKAVRRWFYRGITKLCLEGYFKLTKAKSEDSNSLQRCIHLLKVPEEVTKSTVSETPDAIEYPIRIESTRKDIPLIHLLHDVPFDLQCYQVIDASGATGATANDIKFALNIDEGRILYRSLEEMATRSEKYYPYDICRHLEFHGRQRRYRYFAAAVFRKAQDASYALSEQVPKFPFETRTYLEKNPLISEVAKKKNVKITKRAKAAPKTKTKTQNIGEQNENISLPQRKTRSKRMPEEQAVIPEENSNLLVELEAQQDLASAESTQVKLPESPSLKMQHNKQDLLKPTSLEKSQMSTRQATGSSQTEQVVVSIACKKSIPITKKPVSVQTKIGPTEQKLKKRQTAKAKSEESIDLLKKDEPPEENNNSHESTEANSVDSEASSLLSLQSSGPTSPVVVLSSSPILKKDLREVSNFKTSIPELIMPDTSIPQTDKIQYTVELGLPGSCKRKIRHRVTNVPEAEKTKWKTFKQSNNVTSIYFEQRIKTLQSLMDERRIAEICASFREDFRKRMNSMFNLSTKEAHSRTINTTIQDYVKRGLGKTCNVNIKTVYGTVVTKRLLLHHDVEIGGPLYKKVVDKLNEASGASRPSYTLGELDCISTPIERFDQRIKRLEQTLLELIEKGDMNGASKLQDRIQQTKDNYEHHSIGKKYPTNTLWMANAIPHGYHFSRIKRMMLLHKFLLETLEHPKYPPGVDNKAREITVSSIVWNFTAKLFCQIIGLQTNNHAVLEYLKNEENEQKAFPEIPEDIRTMLLYSSHQFRRKLGYLLYSLQALNCLFVCSSDKHLLTKNNSTVLHTKYKIPKEVAVYNYNEENTPLIEKYSMETKEDHCHFWENLETMYKGAALPKYTENQSPELQAVLKSLVQKRNWAKTHVYSKKERAFLNSYVNKHKKTTPLDRSGLLRQISEEIGFEFAEVRAYYARIERGFEKKRKDKEIQLLKKRAPQTLKPHKRDRIISSHSTYLKRKKLKHTTDFLDDIDDLPDSKTAINMKPLHSSREKWTSQEDEILLYCVPILKQRCRNSPFRWQAITQAIDRSARSCQQRHQTKLSKEPWLKELLSKRLKEWTRLYQAGILSGEIVDNDPYDATSFDLLSLLDYYIRKTGEKDADNQDLIKLPVSRQLVLDNYEVSKEFGPRDLSLSTQYYSARNMSAKMDALVHASLTTCRLKEAEFDIPLSMTKPMTVLEKEVYMYKLIAMMCLLTPDEVYDPIKGYQALEKISQEAKSLALKSLSEGALIVKSAYCHRVIPGTKAGISNTFLKLLSIGNEDLYQKARSFDNYLNQKDEATALNTSSLNSGMAFTILSLASENMATQQDFVTELSLKKTKRDETIYAELKATSEDRKFPCLTLEEIDKKAKELCIDKEGYLSDRLIEKLKECGSEGIHFFELRDKLCNDFDDVEISTCLTRLENSKPPLICQVGPMSGYYVLVKYADDWSLCLPACDRVENQQATECMIAPLNICNSLVGTETPELIEKARICIVDLVRKRPGITKSHICNQLSLFTQRELDRELERLVEACILKEIVCSFDDFEKPSVFSKTRKTHMISPDIAFQTHKQTSYWCMNRSYLKIE
ncbi:hypothetical protein BY458DRAFT_558733 [Sporodiniella umbellata]|nr:hypothetical protein BY458DRAFT_558733 [Sporodiniella umbellata]